MTGEPRADDEIVDLLRRLSYSLAGMVDVRAQAEQTVEMLTECLGLPLTSVAVCDAPSSTSMSMQASRGTRTRDFDQLSFCAGQGLGGRVMSTGRSVVVEDYATDPQITRDFVDVVSRGEGIGGIAAVPVASGDDVLGVLYAGVRSVGSIGDRSLRVMRQAADASAPAFRAAIGTEAIMKYLVATERHRIAGDLHDEVGQLLFSMGVSATQLRAAGGDNSALFELAEQIEQQVQDAAGNLRRALHVLSPQTYDEALPVALLQELQDYSTRTGVWSQPIFQGTACEAIAPFEFPAVQLVRVILRWLETQADVKITILCAEFGASELVLTVQHDGGTASSGPEVDELIATMRQHLHSGADSIQVQAAADGTNMIQARLVAE